MVGCCDDVVVIVTMWCRCDDVVSVALCSVLLVCGVIFLCCAVLCCCGVVLVFPFVALCYVALFCVLLWCFGVMYSVSPLLHS